MKHCCKQFSIAARHYAGKDGLYPDDMRPTAQFEYDDENAAWNINGCCGGGCYVVTNMKFCPYCGVNLLEMEKDEA